MTSVGYIRVSRKILTSEWWNEDRPRTKVEAWLDLIMWARFADGVVEHDSNPVDLRRGEFIGSLRFLAARWQWTIKAVRVFLAACISKERLRLTGNILTRAQQRAHVGAHLGAHVARVYLVVNYDKYNPVQLMAGTRQGTPEGTAKGTKKKKGSITRDPNVRTDPNENIVGDADAPPEWVAEAVKIYEPIGLLSYGRIGKALSPAVHRYGWPSVKPWFAAYVRWRPIQRADGSYPPSFAEAERNVRYCSPEEFVKTVGAWREMCRPANILSHA